MLPTTHTETPEEAAKRQANFIVLRTLENRLPLTLFEQVIQSVRFSFLMFQFSRSFELPKRVDWTGQEKDLTFSELKVNFSQIDQNFLPQLLETVANRSSQQKSKLNSNDQIQIAESKRALLQIGKSANLLFSLKQLHSKSLIADQKKTLIYHQISRFERMKTVFGHALIEEGYNAPIYNVKFDQTGNFVISGADDGIIKIWDKDTLNLQAALHSHEDVITDMDISKCNTYLATASKDGKVIIWDWKKCQKVDEISAHNGTVNNIRFFSFSNKNTKDPRKAFEEFQVLVTCSEDGTIKIYDEIAYLTATAATNSQEPSATRRSRLRNDIAAGGAGQRKERYSITLTPEDYRPGARNKKIDSIHINQNGLLAAGSDKGEVYLWELDFQAFRRQQSKCYNWLGSSKKHTKTVHFCEFSPNGKYLFTGSIDGTAKVWNIERDKSKKGGDQQPKTLALTDDKLLATLEEKRVLSKIEEQYLGDVVNLGQHRDRGNNWQCDSLTWSAQGRYGIAAISGKVDPDQHKEISVIKVYDSQTGHIIQDLAKGNNVQLMNFSFVLAPHPINEEIFMSGSDGGTICLWNIKTRSLIKKFLEYGIYSFEKYTMNDPYDGRFSPDGSSFVVGSVMGTISLFSCEGTPYKYDVTRVEQFFSNDDQKHNSNLYYDNEGQEEPQICGYNLIPYEAQPPSALIGKFKGIRKMSNQDYERNLVLRIELSKEEENFLQGQLQEGLRNDLFNPDNEGAIVFPGVNNAAVMVEQVEQEIRRGNARGRVNSQLSQISNHNNNQNASQEDIEALNGISNAERRVPQRGRRHGIVQRVNRLIMNPNFDPDNSMYDRDSDEDFQLQDADAHSEDEDFEFEGSEEEYGVHQKSQKQSNNRQFRDQTERQEEKKRNEDSRAQRALRRQVRLEGTHQEEEEKGGMPTRGASKRRAIIEESEEESPNRSEEDYAMSDVDDKKINKRKLVKNNRRGVAALGDVPSSDEDSIKSDMLNEDDDGSDYAGRKTRRQVIRGNPRKRSEKSQKERQKRKNLRARKNRTNYAGMDESESDNEDNEEEKQMPSKSEEAKSGPQGGAGSRGAKRNVIKDDSDEEMLDFDVSIPDDKLKHLKGDEDYELLVPQMGDNGDQQVQLQEDMIMQDLNNENRKCGFCLRSDYPLIGPFIKSANKNKPDMGEQLYFHKDCIEVNKYSFFNKQKNKWMNIGKALEQFNKKPSMCGRCGQIGATIQCSECYKYYHGHLCSNLYMIWIGGQNYQCFECRNRANFHMFTEKEPQLDKQEIKQMKKGMQRDFFLSDKQISTSFIPQIGDEVYYFFQGHERFISFYNCYFYCGDEEALPFEYPWRSLPDYLENPTLCKIKNISYRFPSKRVLYLIKKYGKTQQIQQTPQIITHLDLEIIDEESDEDLTFSLDIFPNDLPEFLILKDTYEHALHKYELLLQENKLVENVFRARFKNFIKIKVVTIQQREPTFYPNTNWETVYFRQEEAYRLRERGRRGLRRDPDELEPPEVTNFWCLYLDDNAQKEQEKQLEALSALNDEERLNLINLINDYLEKKKENAAPFMNRVTDDIASDYKYHIPAEMFLTLITSRILNNYYRSQDVNNFVFQFILQHIYFDLDLISANARAYNGDDNPLTSNAKKIVDKLKREIKLALEESNKSKKVEETKISIPLPRPSGKLTAPPRMESGMTTMDQFIKKQQQIEASANQNGSTNAKKKDQLEEIKVTPGSINNSSKGKKQQQQPKYQQSSELMNGDVNVNIDVSDSSDFKVTPKTPAAFDVAMMGGESTALVAGRRSTRQNYKNNYNENYLEQSHQFSTEEKHEDLGAGGTLLGKRTRSGRQQKVVKQTLNDNESDEDFEQQLVNENSGKLNGTRKRLRH